MINNSNKRKNLIKGCLVSLGYTIIMMGTMLACGQEEYWRSSWDLHPELQRQAARVSAGLVLTGFWNLKAHPPPVTHLFQQGHTLFSHFVRDGTGQRGSTSPYGFPYSDNFCLFQTLLKHKIIRSETLFIDYTAFQNTSSKVFLHYIKLLKEEQANSNFMRTKFYEN